MISHMTRRGVIGLSLSILACVLSVSVLLALAPANLRDGIVASFGILSAAGTALAAYAAFRAADSSAGAARDARRALAMHRRNFVYAALWPDHGRAGSPWVWVVYLFPENLEQSPYVSSVRIEWTVDGRQHLMHRDKLEAKETWKIAAQVPAHVAVEEIETHVPQAEITWEDAHRTVAWRSSVRVEPLPAQTSAGVFSPFGTPDWDDEPWASGIGAYVTSSRPEMLL